MKTKSGRCGTQNDEVTSLTTDNVLLTFIIDINVTATVNNKPAQSFNVDVKTQQKCLFMERLF